MKRIASLVGVPAALLAVTVGVAIAASSPTVSTGAASKVTNTSASLQATINPNGNSTGYVFQYGPTNGYGLTTDSRSAGSGTKPVKVATGIGGLTPGTVYHYRVAALNRSGQTFGRDRTFKTTGHPPAAVVTGPPSNVRKTIVTVTGTINPNGAPTTYEFQYGTSTAYGVLTGPQTLPAGTSPVPVSATITGVAPATLFHYRLVAFHGALSTAGGDATFFTEPDHRPKPTVGARTKPGVDRNAPYTFTTSGVLRGAGFIPASSRCAGRVGLRYYKGHRQVAFVLAPVGSNCRFVVRETVRRRFVHGPTPIRIAIHFRGNGYLAPADRTNHVTAG